MSPILLALAQTAARRWSWMEIPGFVTNAGTKLHRLNIGEHLFNMLRPQELISFRYILSMAVADWSGQAWLQGFNDAGKIVFGMSADELHRIKVGVSLLPICWRLKRFLRWKTKTNSTRSSIRQIAVHITLHVGPRRMHTMYVKTCLILTLELTPVSSRLSTGSGSCSVCNFSHRAC